MSKKRKAEEINEYLNMFLSWNSSDIAREIKLKWLASGISDTERAKYFQQIPIDSIEKYAWAIPDDRALRIIQHFAPIVEIGAGKGYWAKLLRDRGVDILPVDMFTAKGKNWTEIVKGGPEVLKKYKNRALMMCYADDYEHSDKPLSTRCLKEYKGDVIILIGEVFSKTLLESPWYDFGPFF